MADNSLTAQIIVKLDGADQVKSGADQVVASVDKIKNAGSGLSSGLTIPAAAPAAMRETAAASRELREAIHLTALPLEELGVPIRGLYSLSRLASAGLGALAGVVGGTAFALGVKQLYEFSEANRKTQEQLEDFAGSDAPKVWDQLSVGAQKAGATTKELVPSYESLTSAVARFNLQQEHAGQAADKIGSQEVIDSVTAFRQAITNTGESAGDAQKATDAWFQSLLEKGKGTVEAFDKLPVSGQNLVAKVLGFSPSADGLAKAREAIEAINPDLFVRLLQPKIAEIQRQAQERIPEEFLEITGLAPAGRAVSNVLTGGFTTEEQRQARLRELQTGPGFYGRGELGPQPGGVGLIPWDRIFSFLTKTPEAGVAGEQRERRAEATRSFATGEPVPSPGTGAQDTAADKQGAAADKQLEAANKQGEAADKSGGKASQFTPDQQLSRATQAIGLQEDLKLLQEKLAILGQGFEAAKAQINATFGPQEEAQKLKHDELDKQAVALQQQKIEADKAELPVKSEELELSKEGAALSYREAARQEAQLRAQGPKRGESQDEYEDKLEALEVKQRQAIVSAEKADLAEQRLPLEFEQLEQERQENTIKSKDADLKFARDQAEQPYSNAIAQLKGTGEQIKYLAEIAKNTAAHPDQPSAGGLTGQQLQGQLRDIIKNLPDEYRKPLQDLGTAAGAAASRLNQLAGASSPHAQSSGAGPTAGGGAVPLSSQPEGAPQPAPSSGPGQGGAGLPTSPTYQYTPGGEPIIVPGSGSQAQPTGQPTSSATYTYDANGNLIIVQPQQNAGGGPIRGPGTGTSDSIFTYLKPGGFVLRASAASAAGRPLLDALHAMADGGGVPSMVSNGEEYFTPQETSSIGSGTLGSMNQLRFGGLLRYLAEGGDTTGEITYRPGSEVRSIYDINRTQVGPALALGGYVPLPSGPRFYSDGGPTDGDSATTSSGAAQSEARAPVHIHVGDKVYELEARPSVADALYQLSIDQQTANGQTKPSWLR